MPVASHHANNRNREMMLGIRDAIYGEQSQSWAVQQYKHVANIQRANLFFTPGYYDSIWNSKQDIDS